MTAPRTFPAPDEDPRLPHTVALEEGTSLRDLATAKPDAGPRLAGHRVRVVLEDPDAPDELVEFEVRVDNRDLLRWDKTAPRQKWDASKTPFIFQTFIAWSAARRAGATELEFGAFEEVCLEATDLKEDEDARPTR